MILYSILFAALCFAAPVRRLLQEEGEVALGGGWAPSRDVTTDEIALWESAMTNTEGLYQGTDLEAIGEPVSVETQVVAGTNYKFTFEDGTTVTVYECPWEDILEVTDVSAAPSDSQNLFGGSGSIGPAWTYDDTVEQPAGTKDMGGWTAAVYTEEQQERLGVDEMGTSSETADMNGVPLIGQGGVGPAWTYDNTVEKPAGSKDMGGWEKAVYTEEQQERLLVDEDGAQIPLNNILLNRWSGVTVPQAPTLKLGGKKKGSFVKLEAPSLKLGSSGSIGPRWTYDSSVEKPQGEKDMGDYTIKVYTEEQQNRLGVNEHGKKLSTMKKANKLSRSGPSWTYDNSVEKPEGEKDMGGWKKAVYTEEQQKRLGVDEDGTKKEKSSFLRKKMKPIRAASRMFKSVFLKK